MSRKYVRPICIGAASTISETTISIECFLTLVSPHQVKQFPENHLICSNLVALIWLTIGRVDTLL